MFPLSAPRSLRGIYPFNWLTAPAMICREKNQVYLSPGRQHYANYFGQGSSSGPKGRTSDRTVYSCSRDLGNARGPVVPVLAVSRIGGKYFIFVAEDHQGKTVAHQRALQIGEIIGNDYVVVNGLKAGEKMVVSGTQFLVDGVPVLPQA